MSMPSFEEVMIFTYENIKNYKSQALTSATLLKKIYVKYPNLNVNKKTNFWLEYYFSSTKGWLNKPKESYDENYGKNILEFILDILVWSGYLVRLNNQYAIDNKKNFIGFSSSCLDYKNVVLIFMAVSLREISFIITDFKFTQENIRKGIELNVNLLNMIFYNGKDDFLNKLSQDVLTTFDAVYQTNQTFVLDKKSSNANDQYVKQLTLEKEKLLDLFQKSFFNQTKVKDSRDEIEA